jgi:hypothetical protein
MSRGLSLWEVLVKQLDLGANDHTWPALPVFRAIWVRPLSSAFLARALQHEK